MTSRTIDQDSGHLHRLELFSDAVFAIAITLLAIELHPPEGWDHHAASFFALMAPKLLAFAISFAVIAVNWMAHRRTFASLTRADTVLDGLNFLMLALVTLTPFVTEVLYDAFSLASIGIYVGTVAAIGFAHGLMWFYAAFIGRLVDPTMPMANRVFVLIAAGVTPGVMCGLSFASVLYNTHWGFVGMAVWGAGLAVFGRLRSRLPARLAAEGV